MIGLIRLLRGAPCVLVYLSPYSASGCRLLLRLRQAAGPHTRLLLADYVLPLACIDEDEDIEPETPQEDEFGKKSTREVLPGTIRTLAPEGSPLLPNLGKANANAYWLDLTVCVVLMSREG